MSGLPVEVVLLRGLLPDVGLRGGDVLAARVLSREGGRGMLALAGARIAAQLPPELEAGARLRVRVQETGGDRVVLRVVEHQPPAAAQAAPGTAADPLAAALRAGLVAALPGGGLARLFVDPEDAGEGGTARQPTRVTLRYEAAAMGRVDLVLDVGPTVVRATVHAPAGVPARRLRDGAGGLRDTLAAATGRPASVTVRERDETVDLRA